MQAPSVEGGIHLLYWDSEMEGMLVNSRNMEVQNHWGPVDASAQLPADRITQFFGQRASYYVPSGRKVDPAMPLCRRLTAHANVEVLGFYHGIVDMAMPAALVFLHIPGSPGP